MAEFSLPNSLPNIPVKLNGKNIYFWKSIVTPLLDMYEQQDYVEGRISTPTKTIEKYVPCSQTRSTVGGLSDTKLHSHA